MSKSKEERIAELKTMIRNLTISLMLLMFATPSPSRSIFIHSIFQKDFLSKKNWLMHSQIFVLYM